MGHLTPQRDPQDERQVRVRLTPKGRSVRERALDYRNELVKKMGRGAADFQHLREELVKLRYNLSEVASARSYLGLAPQGKARSRKSDPCSGQWPQDRS